MTSTWPLARLPTVDDLRTKLCWICRETDEESVGRQWIHPCSCTLVCHADCLLTWIDNALSSPERGPGPMKCPQCATVYQIQSERSPILVGLDNLNVLFSRSGRVIAYVTLSGTLVAFAVSAYCLMAIYGAHAVESFIGRDAFALILGDDPSHWPIAAWLDLPIIPFALLTSRTRFFHLLYFVLPWSHAFTLASAGGGIRTLVSFPPSPLSSLVFFPVVRIAYTAIFDRISRWILDSTPVAVPPAPLNGEAAIAVNAQVNVAPDNLAAAAPAPAENRVLHLTGSVLGRMIGGSLILPSVSKIMGSALLWLSRYSHRLRHFLAVDRPKRYPPIRLGSSISMLGLQPHWAWADLDPVWWRNSIGLGLYLIAMDSLGLYHQHLQSVERKSRRVISRSFEGVDLTNLDLKVPQTSTADATRDHGAASLQ